MTSKSGPATLALKAYHYWRVGGTKALAARVQGYFRARASRNGRAVQPADISGVSGVLANRFQALQPISAFRVPMDGRRLTIITDSISRGSLFGGVGTALVLGALTAQRVGARLRIVTRDEPAAPGALGPLLKLNGISFDQTTEFQFLPTDSKDQLQIHDGDRFITTSWWTTAAAERLPREAQFYLLQEDERMFYPAGDDTVRCEAILADPQIRPIINSQLLFDHLQRDLPDLASRGSFFEPAFPSNHYHWADHPTGGKRTLFFYARPGNPRNLFYLGCEVLRRAVETGLLPADRWKLVLCGKDIPRVGFTPAIEIEYAENLRWDEYAAMVRSSDVGLSLMLTPHPSYPPLDLAASGAAVVSSSYGLKTDLSRYSENIILAPPEPDALVQALGAAVRLAEDLPTRRANYDRNGLERDWTQALSGAVDRIARTYA
jgi:hypothetical protein